jgi:hypothetical protein
MLRSLSEQYARRARLSDAVALLGRHEEIGPELGLVKRITRLRELCGEAEAKLARYIQQENREAKRDGEEGAAYPVSHGSTQDASRGHRSRDDARC